MSAPRRRVLVTGAAGFVGQHALIALGSVADELLGIGRGAMSGLPSGTAFNTVDLADIGSLSGCIKAFRPTHVLHLAAQASVSQAADAGLETWRTNVGGLLNLSHSLLTEAPTATLVFVSTSEVYGRAFLSGKPLTEDAVPQPMGVYARTKRVGEEMLADVLAHSSVRFIILRPFNHTGPGQDERFVVASFANQIARIEAGLVPPRLEVGNLNAQREFLDVRDVVQAYARVIEMSEDLPSGTILNVAGGAPRTIASILEDLRKLARVPFEIVTAKDRLRPSEISVAAGDVARLRAAINWAPRIGWETTLTDLLTDARVKATTQF